MSTLNHGCLSRLLRHPCVLVSVSALLMLPARAQGPPAGRSSAPAPAFDRLAAAAEEARSAGRAGDAVLLYRKALAAGPEWAEGWWNLGTLLFNQDRNAEAAKAFTEAARLKPDAGNGWVMLALSEYRLGRYAESLEHLKRGQELGYADDPAFRNVVLYHEGMLLLHSGEFESAQENFARLVRRGVDNGDVVTGLGLAVLRVRPANYTPEDAAARAVVLLAGRAEHYAAQKKVDEASREYARLAAEYAAVPNVNYAYGRFLLDLQNNDEAVSAFVREIRKSPKHVLARLAIASTRQQTDPAAALPFAREAAELSPNAPLARYLFGSLLLETDQVQPAIAELEAARRLLPGEPKIHWTLARAYSMANRTADAGRARAEFARLKRAEEERAGTKPDAQH